MSADLSQTPRNLLVWDRSSFLDPRNRLSSQVGQLHYNYKVSVLLPECSSAPSHLDSVINSFSSFYLVRNLPIYGLLDKDFLESAVYQGGVYGLSYRSRIDEDTCVALMPNGHLSLSLDKDSFELLGFEGKRSRFNRNRFVVSIDLTDSSMAPGGRSYLRLLTGLTSHLELRSDFLLSQRPGGGASLQPLLARYDWTEHRPQIVQRPLSNLSVPDLSVPDLSVPDLSSPDLSSPLTAHSFLEWLGTVDADISGDNSSSSFLSSLVCPEPRRTVQALSVSVLGLLLPEDVHRLIQELRCLLERPGSWASLTVHGFVDSPVSWGDNEHGFQTGGDNFYSLLLLHGDEYRLHLSTGTQDACPP